jgi:hypothetical protein
MNYVEDIDVADDFTDDRSWWSRRSRPEQIALIASASVVLVATGYAISQGGLVIAFAGVKIAVGKAAAVAAAAV